MSDYQKTCFDGSSPAMQKFTEWLKITGHHFAFREYDRIVIMFDQKIGNSWDPIGFIVSSAMLKSMPWDSIKRVLYHLSLRDDIRNAEIDPYWEDPTKRPWDPLKKPIRMIPWEHLKSIATLPIPKSFTTTIISDAERLPIIDDGSKNNPMMLFKGRSATFTAIEERTNDLFMRCTRPVIKEVIFNDLATIVYWSDGTKTVVKSSRNDEYDPEKGLIMAICKKIVGNDYRKMLNIFKNEDPEKAMAMAICYKYIGSAYREVFEKYVPAADDWRRAGKNRYNNVYIKYGIKETLRKAKKNPLYGSPSFKSLAKHATASVIKVKKTE